jgi:hypothetical protein
MLLERRCDVVPELRTIGVVILYSMGGMGM